MEHNLEIGLLLGGIGIVMLGWLFLVVKAFRDHKLWGVVSLIPPLFLLYGLIRFRRARIPLVILLAGVLIAASPLIYNRLIPVDLGPREAFTEKGELAITLTGWDRSEPSGMAGLGLRFSRWLNNSLNGWDQRDYSVLQTKTDVVILHMANADVTDDTLQHLRGLNKLRELDLSDSSITDAGLSKLKDLQALETLHIKRTGITDAGLLEHLGASDSLKRLSVTGSKVTAEGRKKWRAGGENRKTIPPS